MMHVIQCSTIVVENPFIEQGQGLQSFAKIDVGVESNDGGIPRIISYSYGSNLVLGKIDANSKARPLKMLVARDLSSQVAFQLKDENSNQTHRESLEKAYVSIDTTMCVEESANDKVIKDTMLEEVQITKLIVHNPTVSGGDMNREPPSASRILRMTHQENSEDWEVVTKLLTLKKLLFLKFEAMR